MFQPINFGLRGVGGWLLFFMISVGILRPLYSLKELFGSDSVDVSRLATMYPQTATIINGERIVFSGLVIFGIVVAIMLWKVHTPISVTLAKIFLISNAAIACLDVLVVHNYTDLPPQLVSMVESRVITPMIVTIILSALWFFYFLKSERVRATYLSEPYQY